MYSMSVFQRLTHIEDGDDGGVIPTNDSGNILRLRDLGGDQLKVGQKQSRKRNNG